MTPKEASDRMDKAVAGITTLLRREALTTALDAEGRAKTLAGERMTARTGALRRSIVGRVTDAQPVEIRLSAGGGSSDIRYAAIQEYGGTVRPKKGKWLAIPVGAALTPGGVARHKTPRELQLRFVPIDGARALLVRDIAGTRSKGDRSEIMFVLRRRVELREKRFLRDGMELAAAGLRDRLAGIVATSIEEGLRGQ